MFTYSSRILPFMVGESGQLVMSHLYIHGQKSDGCLPACECSARFLHSYTQSRVPCPGEWCHPQWANLSTSISMIRMPLNRHAQRPEPQCLFSMTDTNHMGNLGLIFARASFLATNQTDFPFKEPAFTEFPLFPLAYLFLCSSTLLQSNPKYWRIITVFWLR